MHAQMSILSLILTSGACNAGSPPQKNNTALVQRLLDANGIVMGKTRCLLYYSRVHACNMRQPLGSIAKVW